MKSGDKIYIKLRDKKVKGTYLKSGGTNVAIVKEVGKLNKQGYSIARPFGIEISLISKR